MKSTMKGTLALAALLLVISVVLTSCGGGGSSGSSGGGGGGSASSSSSAASSSSPAATTKGGASSGMIKTVAIKETNFKLSPSSVTLSKPGTYAFKAQNNGSVQHSLTIEGKGVKGEGGEGDEVTLKRALNPGQSGVLTVSFQKPGTYEMYCPVDGHEQMGMKGKVVVK
jgi:uncharacterized cupredoxin-like copper-binding protein